MRHISMLWCYVLVSVQANLIRTVHVNTREFHQDKLLQFNLLLATNIS